MTIEMSVQNHKGQIRIKDEMTIYTAAQVRRELMEKLETMDDFEVSLGDVSEMDTAGVQVLIHLAKAAESQKKHLSFVDHSEAVINVFETLNLAAFFGDPIVMPATKE